jgi:hypothetical protein
VIVDRHGTPLAVSLTGGNRHDVTQLIPLLDAIPRIRGLRGRPRHSRSACTPTEATTSASTADLCGPAVSSRRSPSAAPRTAPAWARSAGS